MVNSSFDLHQGCSLEKSLIVGRSNLFMQGVIRHRLIGSSEIVNIFYFISSICAICNPLSL